MHTRPLAVILAASLAALTLSPVLSAPLSSSATGRLSASFQGGPESAAEFPARAEVMLITGDRVVVETTADGRSSVDVEPAKRDGFEPTFDFRNVAGQAYVIPSDARALVGSVLDRELFNVTKLAEYGFDDELPVIVSLEGGAAARAPALPQGLTPTVALPAVDAVAAAVGRRFWRSAAPPAGRGSVSALAASSLDGVEMIWLDDKVDIALDESVPQVGAPQAWAAGYDGAGLEVAVLDTGIDAEHPDLVGKVIAEVSFVPDASPDDDHGHGTHVAGIIAGSGAASDAAYAGVAPGALLLNGRVIDAGGSGQESWIMAGMQWAADEGADVVNMSLGGAPTDGTDPMSELIDTLTATTDTLFVVAAGNDGPGESTAGSPGVASAAVTVGAVTKDDELADFSSRGPRLGDFAIKPDLTGPGVDITAARAGGTDIGDNVDDHYTALSGTSMATPHVAGAAAILRQHDPDLTAAEVKALLVGTASPADGPSVYEQGGGRLDVAAAIDASVYATVAPLDLGHHPWPHDDAEPVSVDVTYMNRGDAAQTLELAFDVRNAKGDLAGSEMLSASTSTLTLAPDASATVTTTLDLRRGATGLYGGYLTATAGGEVASRVPVGFHKEPERYELTVEGIARDGQTATRGYVDVIDVVEGGLLVDALWLGDVDGRFSVSVPRGTYAVVSHMESVPEGDYRPSEMVFVAEPEVEVTEDTTVVLDARPASPIVIETPRHPTAEPLIPRMHGYWRKAAASDWYIQFQVNDPLPGFAVATDPVSVGEFEFYHLNVLGDEDYSTSPYLYYLVYAEPGHVPAELRYVAHQGKLATVVNAFHSDIRNEEYSFSPYYLESRGFWRPWAEWAFLKGGMIEVQRTRHEYLVPEGLRYLQQVRQRTLVAPQPLTSYTRAERRDWSWFESVWRPGFVIAPTWFATTPLERQGDTLALWAHEFVDAAGNYDDANTTGRHITDTVDFKLYENDALIAQHNQLIGKWPVSPGPATYRLEAEITRELEGWLTSPRTRTTWTVKSAGTGAGLEVLPALQVDYEVDVDLSNRVRRGAHSLKLRIGHLEGSSAPPLANVRVWISLDDGATWVVRRVRTLGDGTRQVTLGVPPRTRAEFVSLRVHARDRDGNAIEQEVTRAYGIQPLRPIGRRYEPPVVPRRVDGRR